MSSSIVPPTVPGSKSLASRLTPLCAWLASLWLFLMTGWYVAVAVRSVIASPGRADLRWTLLLAAFVVTVVISHLLVRRRFITLIWLGMMAAVALAMIGLSHQLVAALITGWLIFLCWSWGDWTLRQLGILPARLTSYDVSIALPLGLALMALVTLALSLTHRLTSMWVWPVFAGLTLVQWRCLPGVGSECRRLYVFLRRFAEKESGAEAGVIVVLLGCVFVLDLSWSLAPEVRFDALSAHLPVAKYYGEHSVVLLTYGYLANLVDLLFALALSLHGQIVAKLLMLASSVITTLGVYAFGRRLFGARVGLWAAALFFSVPLVSWLSSTAYVDAGVTMFLFSSLMAFFRWREDRKTGWLWASGLLMGAALAAKMNALLGLPVIGSVLVWDLLRSSQPARARLRALAGYLLGISLVVGPGFIVCYALAGDPFYPLHILDRVFKGANGSLIPNADTFGIGTSMSALLKLPFAFTFETQKFGEGLPSDGIGLALLLAPLALLTLISGRVVARKALILFAVCLVYFGCLAFIMQYGRYYIPVLPVVSILAAVVLAQAFKKWFQRVNRVLLGVAVATQVVLTPLAYMYMADRFPVRMALGFETRESFLTRSLTVYPPAQFLNKKIEPGHKVVGVGAPTLRFYLNAPMATQFDSEVLQIVANSSPTTLASHFIEDGFSYLFVDRGLWANAAPPLYAREPFLSQFTTLEYATSDVKVYRIRPVAMEPRAVANLLTNPGFELLNESSYPAGWVPYGRPQISQTSESAHGGKVAIRADPEDGLLTTVPVESGETYTLGHWTRADLPNQQARLQINWLDKNSQVLGVSIDLVSAGPTWAWNQLSATAPEGAVMAVVGVSVWESSKVWFDDYSFVKGDIPTNQKDFGAAR